MTVRFRPRHPALAATLSFLFPGLGQAFAGDRRLAAMLAVPVLLLAGGALVVALLFGTQVRNQLLSTPVLVSLLALDVVLLAWRLFAILQAGLAPSAVIADVAPRPARATLAALLLLAIATVGMHFYAGMVLVRLNAALEQVFSGGGGDGGGGGGSVGEPLNQPEYRWDGTERLNFLLLGIDAAPGRRDALPDTILVVSVDPAAREAVMVSIPRDTGFLPLPDTTIHEEGLYPRKINQLAREATAAPDLWCADTPGIDPDACGIRALQRSVGLYLGISIHHYALVDLAGFAQLIDAVGGVRLCLEGYLSDEAYLDPITGERGIHITSGCARRTGNEALAYARIRQGVLVHPDGTQERQDDFKRAARQQEVLLALRDELAAADLVFELPALLDAIGRTVSTDFPRSLAGDLASLLPLIAGPDIERVVLGLPRYVDPPVDPGTNYLLIPRRDAIRAEAERLFGTDGPLEGWYVGSDAELPPDGDGA
jgi:LCP family protein required for cell wall assembly